MAIINVQLNVDTEGTELTLDDVKRHFEETFLNVQMPITKDDQDQFPMFFALQVAVA